ncbi:hypothetical protein CORT_0H01870 [Candida orthopsilosis Co 90-125]|uniref:Glutaredoxin domain-containing protein n=1 Tax=Candida orthopsilosis (strain 90-125) TaxID=1136231 RepID=H8XB51_CANO9|nr:hypothetical protein CORT_0H01870 [Candida orthopsilosis Co 90-125]CCG25299.1 hypothetical protein CORT_0H01870 [Candida orthopsilosis Co 90-125]
MSAQPSSLPSSSSNEYISKAKSLISEYPYLMLSKSWCPDCHYVYNLFQQLGIYDKLHIIELDQFKDQDEATALENAFTEIVGKKWVPSLFFQGKYWGNEQDLKNLRKQGQLESELKKLNLLV